jgi:hypothetical protein
MVWYFILAKGPNEKRACMIAKDGRTRLRIRANQWDETHVSPVLADLRRDNPNWTFRKQKAF